MGKEIAEILKPAARGALRAERPTREERRKSVIALARRSEKARSERGKEHKPRRATPRRAASRAGLVPLGRDFHNVREVAAK